MINRFLNCITKVIIWTKENTSKLLTCKKCGSQRFHEGPEGGMTVWYICADCNTGIPSMGPVDVFDVDRDKVRRG